ncbi:hypothetical protein D3C86_1653050 [compost metagenome]
MPGVTECEAKHSILNRHDQEGLKRPACQIQLRDFLNIAEQLCPFWLRRICLVVEEANDAL